MFSSQQHKVHIFDPKVRSTVVAKKKTEGEELTTTPRVYFTDEEPITAPQYYGEHDTDCGSVLEEFGNHGVFDDVCVTNHFYVSGSLSFYVVYIWIPSGDTF